MIGEEQHPPPPNNTSPTNDQRGPNGGEQQHLPQQQHDQHGLSEEEPNQQLNESSTDGELQEARGRKGKTLKTKRTTAKLKAKTTSHETIKKALNDSYAICSAKDKENLVKDVTPNTTATSYANALQATSSRYDYLKQFSPLWNAYEQGIDPKRTQHNTLDRMDQGRDVYENNKARSITLWASIETTSATVIEAVQSRLSEPVANVVLEVERDTRVRSTAKINIITTTDAAANHLLTNGIRIGTRTIYPRTTRPRPPPTRRGYLPNFPVAANEAHLEEAAGEKSITILKITPRLHRNTTIKIGGWTIWTDLDSPTPDTLHFDGEEYAIIWRSKKTTANNRTGPTANNTVNTDKRPDNAIAERPIAAKHQHRR